MTTVTITLRDGYRGPRIAHRLVKGVILWLDPDGILIAIEIPSALLT